MEILALLESRINDLLQQLDTLRIQNRALYDAAAHVDVLQQENSRLEAELEQERALRASIETRVSDMINRLSSQLDNPEEQ